MAWLKLISVVLMLSILLSAASGVQNESDELAPPSIPELTANITTNLITVTEMNYKKNVVSSEQFEALLTSSVKELSGAYCYPPKDRNCVCAVEKDNPRDFRCYFQPPVDGIYKLTIDSKQLNASGNFTLELFDGKAPLLKQEIRQETVSMGTLLFALTFAVIMILAYVAYFIYKLMMRRRDALNSAYDERTKIEDDMKVLRYRFFKREIDNTTYNSLLHQKEVELAVVNEKIVKLLKSKQKPVEEIPPQ